MASAEKFFGVFVNIQTEFREKWALMEGLPDFARGASALVNAAGLQSDS